MTEIEHIHISNLVIDSAQSRTQQNWGADMSDQQLVESVGEDGVLNPLLVRPVEMTPYDDDIDEDYSIIAGSRRFKAAMEAGVSSVPCRVIEADDLEATIKSLKENKERKDLTQRETMMSIKAHYEILGGDELEDGHVCGQCGDEFGTAGGLNKHRSKTPEHTPTTVVGVDDIKSRTEALDHIALTHYPGVRKKHAKTKVKEMLGAVELPDDYLILLSDPDSRSEVQKDKLREFGIDPDREFGLTTGGDFEPVIELYNEVDSVSGVNADSRVLSALGDIDFGQDNENFTSEVEKVREKFVSDAKEVESVEEKIRLFDDVVSNKSSELREIHEEIGTSELGSVKLSFEEQRYKRLHALAKRQQKIEHNTEIVGQAYKSYLDDLAKKHGW
jgi:hypothetical protein